MQSIALVIHVALAVGLIGLVLIQHGKGADAGAAFGSGASATVFGARGSASFMTRMTTGVAAAFFLTSLVLFYLAANRDRGLDSVTDLPGSVVEQPADEAPVEAPASDLPGGVEEEPASDLPNAETDAPVNGSTGSAVDTPSDGSSSDQGGSASDPELPQAPETAPAATPADDPASEQDSDPASSAPEDAAGQSTQPAAKE